MPKNPKFEISQFFIQLWWRPFLEVCMNFCEQICCAFSDKMSFEVFSPIWSHVNKRKMPKIQNQKFHNSLYKFGRDLSQKDAGIWGSESVMCFQRRCRLKVFSPIWSYVNENEKKKLRMQNFEKQKKNGLEIMVTKFSVSLLDSSSAVQQHKAELKIRKSIRPLVLERVSSPYTNHYIMLRFQHTLCTFKPYTTRENPQKSRTLQVYIIPSFVSAALIPERSRALAICPTGMKRENIGRNAVPKWAFLRTMRLNITCSVLKVKQQALYITIASSHLFNDFFVVYTKLHLQLTSSFGICLCLCIHK